MFQAVLALKGQLKNRDVAIVAAAANTILNLEQTRMRHSAQVAGSEDVSEAQEEFEAEARQESERSAAARAAKQETTIGAPAPAEGNRTDARALEEHAQEVAAAFEGEEEPMPIGRAMGCVRSQLKMWGIAASAIPRGGFRAALLERGRGATPA